MIRISVQNVNVQAWPYNTFTMSKHPGEVTQLFVKNLFKVTLLVAFYEKYMHDASTIQKLQ